MLPATDRKRPYPPKTCEVCGASWQPVHRQQVRNRRTCSTECQRELRGRTIRAKPRTRRAKYVTLTCATCGAEFDRLASQMRNVKTPTCSCRCNGVQRAKTLPRRRGPRGPMSEEKRIEYRKKMAGPNSPTWKGGVLWTKGYGEHSDEKIKNVRCPEWARSMARKSGYVKESRLLMAEMVGRPLTRTEVVHHRDGHPGNNARENLELWPTQADHVRAERGKWEEGVANVLLLEAEVDYDLRP